MNVGQIAIDSIKKFGEFTSLYYEGKSHTNVELDLTARKLARVLLDHGVTAGDRVLVMMPNSPSILVSFQACWKIGAAIVPVTPMLNAREVSYLLQDSGAKAALTLPVLASRVHDAGHGIETLHHLLVIGPTDAAGAKNIESLIDAAEPHDGMADTRPDDMAVLLYTSGTTGNPKGVMLTHSNMVSNAEAVTRLTNVEPYGMSMHILPLSHSFGVMMMNVGMMVGARAAMLPFFDTVKAFQTIQEHKVEQFSAVPTMLNYMVNHADRTKYDMSSLKRVVSGGAALANEVRLEFEKLFPGCEVREGYGLSETAPTACGYRDGEEYRPGSVGRAIDGVNVCIMDNDFKVLGPRETGEICIKGPNVMAGYWNNPEATEAAVINGWLHSGDVGFMDEEGFVYITDRKKDIIIKGGENISPREIEEAIYEHPSVAEVAVVGVPDDTLGETIAAVVVLKSGQKATEEEILYHAAKYVTKFKVPTYVQFVPFMPKNPIGKILKKDIRKMIGDQIKKKIAAQQAAGNI